MEEESSVLLDTSSSTQNASDTTETSFQEIQTTNAQASVACESEDLTAMGQCLCRQSQQTMDQHEIQPECPVLLQTDERQTVDAFSNTPIIGGQAEQTNEENEVLIRSIQHAEHPEDQSHANSYDTCSDANLLPGHNTEENMVAVDESDQIGEEESHELQQRGQETHLQSAMMGTERENFEQEAEQRQGEESPLAREGEVEHQEPLNPVDETRHEENTGELSNAGGQIPDGLEGGRHSNAESVASKDDQDKGTLPQLFDRENVLIGEKLHKLLENPSDLLQEDAFMSYIERAKEIDLLYPNKLDGPPVRFYTHFKTTDLEIFILLAIPNLQALRLPRFRSEKGSKSDDFFLAIARKSSSLTELVFEDDGTVSTRTANTFFQWKKLEKLEIYRPEKPVLRALTIGVSPPEKIRFHALKPHLEKDIRMFLIQKGGFLKVLHLGFDLPVQEESTTSVQRCFWSRMISFFDYQVPISLPQLIKLELSSAPSFKVKHRFNSSARETGFSETERALRSIQELIHAKCTTRHPKETAISLTEIRLCGGVELIVDALSGISWVNQRKMGVQVEFPGVHVAFQKGYGEVSPVVLQSLQLDQFIFERTISPWVEFTALKEIDLGETTFIQRYSTGDVSMREATRRLLVTSRESLSRVSAYHEMPTRQIVMDTAKIIREVVALAPYVSRLDLSGDIVLHAAVSDMEYVDALMMLRPWELKTLHLHSVSNYDASTSGRKLSEGGFSRNAFAEFLKRLPAFLTILAMVWPRLESLVLEWKEMDPGVDKLTAKKLIPGVFKALDVYETNVPTVNVATVRWLVREWHLKCKDGDKKQARSRSRAV